LFESQLALTWDLNLTKVPVSLIEKSFQTAYFKWQFESIQSQNVGRKYLQKSVSFDFNIEFKIDANPGLA